MFGAGPFAGGGAPAAPPLVSYLWGASSVNAGARYLFSGSNTGGSAADASALVGRQLVAGAGTLTRFTAQHSGAANVQYDLLVNGAVKEAA